MQYAQFLCKLHENSHSKNAHMIFTLKSQVSRVSFLLLGICLSCTVLHAQTWEMRYLRNLEKNRSKASDAWMKGLSETAPPLCVATPAALFLTSLITENRPLRRASITGGIGLAITVGSTYGLKHLIKRPRPYNRYPQELKPLGQESSFSMPSGHTSTAFYTATWLTLEYPKWYVAVPAYLWAGTIGYSRNHLGVHYLTDVLVGAALGSATGWAVWRMRR
jgi:hypothetical protein